MFKLAGYMEHQQKKSTKKKNNTRKLACKITDPFLFWLWPALPVYLPTAYRYLRDISIYCPYAYVPLLALLRIQQHKAHAHSSANKVHKTMAPPDNNPTSSAVHR